MIEAEKYRKFSNEHDYTAFSVVRVFPKILKSLGGKYTWITIHNGNSHIYRLALGGKSSTGFNAKAIKST